MEYDLSRFVEPHKDNFETALNEIKSGRKQSHWMWYIFPQVLGLGSSSISVLFAIKSREEAKAFLKDDYLGNNLIIICEELLKLPENDPVKIFRYPDCLKLKSSMTLFSMVSEDNPVFDRVLEKYFDGEKDTETIKILKNEDA